MVKMVKSGSLAVLLVGLLAQHGLASPDSSQQLRGQAAATATPATSVETPEAESADEAAGIEDLGVFAACSCPHTSEQCDCSLTRLGEQGQGQGESANSQQAHQNLTKHLQSRAEAMRALWKEQDKAGMKCSCHQGSTTCQCTHEIDEKTLDAKLKNETESTLSMWWAAHGGGYHPYHPMYRPMYHGGGCRGGHYGGCGCAYVGCRCAHGGYHACGWR